MATYHFKLTTIARGRGQSSVAAAAYRSGEKLRCEREGETKYPRRNMADVLFTKLFNWPGTRAALWSQAELAETRKNAVVAREWTVALPKELSADDRQKLATDFARWLVRTYGVAADLAIHRPRRDVAANENHHAHVMMTTRVVEDDHFGPKTRIFDDRATGSVEIAKIRKHWEMLVNKALKMAGIDACVSSKKASKPQPKLTLRQAAALRRSRGDQAVSVTLRQLSNAGEEGLTPAANIKQAAINDPLDLVLPPPATKQKSK